MKQQYVYGLAAFFAIVGLSIFGYKWQVLGFPVSKDLQTPVWTIESSIGFDSGPGSIKVNLHIPTLTPGFRMLNENSVSRGYGFSLNYGSGGREAQWAIRRADGQQRIYYRISVYEDSRSDQSDTTPPFPPPPVINEPFRTAVDVIVADVKEQSADTASFTAELLRRMNDASPGPNIELLLSNADTRAEFVESMTTILASARIPARMIHGFELQGRLRSAVPITWLEVHDGDRWRYFDPLTGEEHLPERFFIWWRGNEPLISVEGGSNVEVDFAVQENHLAAVAIAETQVAQQGATMIDFSLYSLPIQTQAVYSVLLMIPIGALVMVVLRNMVGIDAFGTFMPVLIALAFRETQLLWGVILFTLLVTLGLSIRFLLERLRLLLVPRLSAVLIIVVILMLMISLVSHRLGMETGLSVALFPMVIIAMTIERMSVVWEERGAVDAMRAGFGSLIVAVAAYVFMGFSWLEHLLFTFPELLLVVLSLVVLAGRYTGYRLLELNRFKALMEH
ncbi:MAG: UUP1 family membrane protein [Gammaproteobacteria bacterium]|nr:UUP1 family membrane protein [Gammaproteobacteria bacterium]MDH3415380.1 UUP1 family membrane protein [Gammaproteobacteria bacterium]